MPRWILLPLLLVAPALALAADRELLPPHGLKKGPKQAEKRPIEKRPIEKRPVESKVGKKLIVAFDRGTVSINGGKALTLMFDQKELIAALGQPDREAKLSNTLLTWDSLGIFAYVKPDSPKVHAVSIALDRDASLDFWPKKDFAGTATVDGAVVTRASTIEQINKVKKGLPFEKNEFLTDSWSFKDVKGSVYLRKGPDGFVALEIGVLPE